MAVQKLLTSTETSITLQFYGYGTDNRTDDVRIEFYCKESTSSTWEMHTQTLGPTDSSVSYTFYGLQPGTDYDLKGRFVGINDTYDYGPYSIRTQGTSYTEMTGNAEIYYAVGTAIAIRLYGVNTLAGYDRTVNIYYKKSGGSYVYSDSFIISGSSYLSSFTRTIYGLSEKTNYTVLVEVINPFGEKLKEWELSATTGFDTSGSLSVSNVTEKGCTLNVSNIPNSPQYPRTLKWYGKEGANGEWELLHTNTVAGGATYTYTNNDLIPKTYYGFKVEIYAGGGLINTTEASCTTSEASGSLSVEEVNEYSATVLLSGLVTGVSYVRVIKWFYKASTDTNYTKFNKEINLLQDASSAKVVIDEFASNTTYSIKAEIYNTAGKLLGSKVATTTTLDTSDTLEQSTTTSASIRLTVKDLKPAAYTRIFEWYYKRQNDKEFALFDATEKAPEDANDNVSVVVKPLIAKTYYDFKVLIKKQKATMKELTLTCRTLINNEIVPDTEISQIYEEVGSKTVKVYWDAPEHENGFFYKVQYSESETDGFTDIAGELSSPPAEYTEITLPALDKTYYIRIHSYYTVENETASKYSLPMGVYMYSLFDWETPKVQGQPFMLTASEWNELIKDVQTRHRNEGIEGYSMDLAVKGREITCSQYNQVVKAIDAFNPTGLKEETVGNAISAAVLNTLKDKVNLG